MGPCYPTPEGLEQTPENYETTSDADEWRRWDEELVEDFGRWLSRLAKAFAILLLAVSAAIAIGWF
ncbi:MAG: hypothetical protein KAU38_14555 [Desulfobacterales bacterium]|nr:hypothetical protein [Desulfobacterales bacterium]